MALRPQVAPELLSKVTKALGITVLDQWYYVTHHAATKAIGPRALNLYGGTVGFLKAAYPQHDFDEEKLTSRRNKEKDQRFIEVIIRKLFPNTEIQTKVRKAVGVKNPETDAYLEIDIWIPSLKLGIEYQDKHHYNYQWYANGALEDYQKRDNIKKVTMPALGYTLIVIGYWWDKTPESIVATIRKFRPDLLQGHESVSAEPIPSEPPPELMNPPPVIPGVAGIMSPFVPTNNFNPTNWFAGEKLDGIRGVYNPTLRKMFSRSGKELSLIPSLLNDIPNILVEGEIMAGRGNYSKTAAVSYHTHHDKVNWPMFRYVLYDIPDAEWENYTTRYSAITTELFAHHFLFAQSAFRVVIVNKPHLKMLLDAIISDSGEGVIAQKDTPYEYGRAKGLAKIKVRRDADAKVLRINKRSCTCKLVSGVTADIVFGNNFDPSKVEVGDIISYYYKGYSLNGTPKQGEIYKIRYDITWEDLILEKARDTVKRSSMKAIGSGSLSVSGTTKNKMGHWNKSANVRAFFDKFGLSAGFDPLVTENWYYVTHSSLMRAKGSGLLKAFSFNLMRALSCAYPELKFVEAKLRNRDKPTGRTKGFWNSTSNIKEFFDEFARKSGFDPLIPENWYQIRGKHLGDAGGGGLLKAFDFNLIKAVSRAYPKLNFEGNKFKIRGKTKGPNKGHWHDISNVRAFFDRFAHKLGFDPLVAENWYLVKNKAIQNAGGSGLLKAHGSNLQIAISCAYPELKFKEGKFSVPRRTRGHWNNSANVRSYFDECARKAGFDPLVAENWYSVKGRLLRNAGGSGLLKAFNFNLANALSYAYPELKFDAENFRTWEKSRGKCDKERMC